MTVFLFFKIFKEKLLCQIQITFRISNSTKITIRFSFDDEAEEVKIFLNKIISF
jgi:hypothetical protein